MYFLCLLESVYHGGGAKGAAHIGVLQALIEEGIDIDYISGCSSGSIVAALYALGYSPMNILNMFTTYCKYISDYDKMVPLKIVGMVFTGKLKLKGIVKGNNLENIIRKFCTDKNIADISNVKMPLAIPAVDIKTGEIIYYLSKEANCNYIGREDIYDDIPSCINNGDLASIVRASSSFPGVFEPKYLDGKYLVDGAVRMNCPVEILKKMGADKVIAVTFDDNKSSKLSDYNVISITMKSFDIMGHEINKEQLDLANYIINPKINNTSLLDCKNLNYIANIGYNTTKENIAQIREAIS